MTLGEVDAMAAKLFGNDQVPKAQFPVDVYWIRYTTIDIDGSRAVITSQVFVPAPQTPTRFPIYVFGTGSTGLVDPCRPSREHIAGIRWGLYRSHVLSHAGQGTIGVLPDYLGFSDPERIQPYFIAEVEGRLMLDAIRAAAELLLRMPTYAIAEAGAFIAGFSQGGHAAFAAADLRATYAPDVQLAGIIGYGATTDIPALFLDFTVSAPLVIYVYSRQYGIDRFDPKVMLQPRWASTLEHDVTTQCIGGIQSYYPWEAEQLFTREFYLALNGGDLAGSFPEIEHIMSKNSTGLSGHGIPAFMAQGMNDPVVSAKHQDEFVARLCELGSAVRYIKYNGLRHDTRQISFHEVRQWMQDRITGDPAPSDCRVVNNPIR
jgi:acetyl esterase/lipase